MRVARNRWLLLSLSLVIACSSRVLADEPFGFGDLPVRTLTASPFTDADVDHLLATLDALLERDAAADPSTRDASNDLWRFRERLQAGRLDAGQEARVLEHLDALGRIHPELTVLLERERRLVRTLTVGKPAPEIVGQDLYGQELRLSDARGSVVVLAFSGEWCGSCRLEYPYLRLLSDVYKDRPLTILSVDSDRDPAVAAKAKAARGLTYRSWWDGGSGAKSTEGVIATAWGVIGWPTTYVLDDSGVIRFVNLRKEDLLKAVRQLMDETTARPAPGR